MIHTKIYLLALVAMLLPATAAMAQIPNAGFETWETGWTFDGLGGVPYPYPAGWSSGNSIIASWTGSAGPFYCEQGTPGATGVSFATITTRSLVDWGGTVHAGRISTAPQGIGPEGFPYTVRPVALTGQWQYGIQPQDTGMVRVHFWKWNNATQERDTVGVGIALVLGEQDGWSDMLVPIVYASPATPDSACIVIASSLDTPLEGSFIKVDDLGFDFATTMAEAPVPAFRLFPSPTTEVLHITAGQWIDHVQVLDMAGRTVMSQRAAGPLQQLDMAGLMAGRYMMRLRLADGACPVRSFVKQ